jgi:hypothetical protein
MEEGVRATLKDDAQQPRIRGCSLPHVVEGAMFDQGGPQLFLDLDPEKAGDPLHFSGEVSFEIVEMHQQHWADAARSTILGCVPTSRHWSRTLQLRFAARFLPGITGLFSVADRYLPFLRRNFLDPDKNSEPALASTTYGDGLSGSLLCPGA